MYACLSNGLDCPSDCLDFKVLGLHVTYMSVNWKAWSYDLMR